MHRLLKQAFTLIELLVVIAIIGILSGLIIVGMNGMTQKATIAKAQVFSNSLKNSLLMSIVGEWKFDGATSERPAVNADVVDSWGGVNNGTIPASPSIPTIKTASNCVSGSCLSFDGVDDYVSCGYGASLQTTGVITLGAWIKSNYSNWETILVKDNYNNNGYYFGTAGHGQLYFYTFSGGVLRAQPSNSIITDNRWHYVAVTYDGNKVIYYVDGVSAYMYDWGSYLALGNDINYDLRIGNYSFNGSIDDVRIYNAAIPTSQIKEQYYAGLNKLLANGGITKDEYQDRVGELAIEL